MADCKTYREEIEESVGVESVSLEARTHASACPSCGEFGREHDALRRLVGGLGKVEAPADFEFRLRARIKATRGGGKYNFLGLHLAPGLAWAAAACFIIISASLYVWQQRTSPQLSQQASRGSETLKSQPGAVVENRATENNPAIREAEDKPAIREELKVGGSTETVARNDVGDNARRVSPRRFLREVALKGQKRESPTGGSSEFSLTGAKILRLKIPLNASAESLRFIVTDERGKTRPVPMRAVSFGSQEMVAGVGARTRMVATDKGGVW